MFSDLTVRELQFWYFSHSWNSPNPYPTLPYRFRFSEFYQTNWPSCHILRHFYFFRVLGDDFWRFPQLTPPPFPLLSLRITLSVLYLQLNEFSHLLTHWCYYLTVYRFQNYIVLGRHIFWNWCLSINYFRNKRFLFYRSWIKMDDTKKGREQKAGYLWTDGLIR